VEVTRAELAGVALLVLVACGTQPRTPGDVVAAYFATLGRDPIRSLALTTEAFHHAHGLSTVTTSEARDWRGGAEFTPTAEPERIDRAQVAWLAIQGRDDFARIASGLVATPVNSEVEGDTATMVVSIEPAHAPPFRQTFRLTREGSESPWRIVGIEQSGVEVASETAAFVAYPAESTRRAIQRRVRHPAQTREVVR
jgi:hypothetical protein